MRSILRKTASFLILILACFGLAQSREDFFATAQAEEEAGHFRDMTGSPLYDPWIGHFARQGFAGGYHLNGRPTGLFGPHDEILRSEMAKVSAAVRLAEEAGIAQEWFKLGADRLAEEVLKAIRPWRNCGEGNINCANIGHQPFPDVAYKKIDCERQPGERPCDPWYAEFVYFAVDRGYLQGYLEGLQRRFRPERPAARIHALKIVIADNGHVSPEQDLRFLRLAALARQKGFAQPLCLVGAEERILQNNAGDRKLLAYALLADRLRLFGESCELFAQAGKTAPAQRADFLQRNVTRKEAVRWLGMTTTYAPLRDLSFVPQSGEPPEPEEWAEKALEELAEEAAEAEKGLLDGTLAQEEDLPEKASAEEGDMEKLLEDIAKKGAEERLLEEGLESALPEPWEAMGEADPDLPLRPKANPLDSPEKAMDAWSKAKGSEAVYQKVLKLADEKGVPVSVSAYTPLKILEQNESHALVWPQGYLRPYWASCSQTAGLCPGNLVAANGLTPAELGLVPAQSKTLSPKELLESGIAVYAAKPMHLCKSEYDCFAIPQGTKMLSAGGTIKSRTSSDGKTGLWQPVIYDKGLLSREKTYYALVRDVLYKTDDQPLLDALFADLKKNLDWHVTRNAEIIGHLEDYYRSHTLQQTLDYGLGVGTKEPKDSRSFEYRLVMEWGEGKRSLYEPSRTGWLPADPDIVTVRYWKDLTLGEQRVLHYHRNVYQDDLPSTETEAIKNGQWEFKEVAIAHNLAGATGNRDYRGIGERLGQQAIYDPNGSLVFAPENMGTYDFFPPGESLPNHSRLDVKPWIEWGNSSDDRTTKAEREEAYDEGLKRAARSRARSVGSKINQLLQ